MCKAVTLSGWQFRGFPTSRRHFNWIYGSLWVTLMMRVMENEKKTTGKE